MLSFTTRWPRWRSTARPSPHSLGLMYEDITGHLDFLRSSDEYKVMALASYGKPRFAAGRWRR